jgi:hypothetical protein
MDSHENARTTPHGRMLIVQRLAAGQAVGAVAAALGLSATTFLGAVALATIVMSWPG